MFLLGAALAVFGWFVGHMDNQVTASNQYGEIDASCGSPFDPRSIRNFFPALAQACTRVLEPGRYLAIACLVIGGVLLVRLLYMLIGPKIPGPRAEPHTEGHD